MHRPYGPGASKLHRALDEMAATERPSKSADYFISALPSQVAKTLPSGHVSAS